MARAHAVSVLHALWVVRPEQEPLAVGALAEAGAVIWLAGEGEAVWPEPSCIECLNTGAVVCRRAGPTSGGAGSPEVWESEPGALTEAVRRLVQRPA